MRFEREFYGFGYKAKLLSVGDVFSVTETTDKDGKKVRTYTVENLKEQMAQMRKYHEYVKELISVRRTSNYTAKKGIYTDTTKTKKSQRSLKFPESVINLLRAYKDEQDNERLRLGSKWVDHDRLFVKWNGEPMNNNTPYFWFREFCDIHSLRHFYASALINEGVDAAAVSCALGHSVISTTTSIYCHVFQQAQARAGDAIASVLDFSSKNKQNAKDTAKDSNS